MSVEPRPGRVASVAALQGGTLTGTRCRGGVLNSGMDRSYLAAGQGAAGGYGIGDANAVSARWISAFALLLRLFFSVRSMMAARRRGPACWAALLITSIDAAETGIAKVSSFWEAFSKTAPIPNWKRAS
jgi:hypothetical protein